MDKFIDKDTERQSAYDNLELKSVREIMIDMNREDRTVPFAVDKVMDAIVAFVEATVKRMQNGGRLFYIGAGTSGRLGVLDASECPPTFGVPKDLVTGLIAGGDYALRNAVEFSEDNSEQGWDDLVKANISEQDMLLGIAASGSTPYVLGALEKAKNQGILTGSLACNTDSPISRVAEYPIEVITGPEYVTGSTRLKAGTAQKLVLNMISTSVMIKLGRIQGNRMVDMQLSNNKLVNRGILMLEKELGVTKAIATELLEKYKSVRTAIQSYRSV